MTLLVAAPALADLSDLDRQLLRAIVVEHAIHRRGPTWREIRAAIGFDPPPEIPLAVLRHAHEIQRASAYWGTPMSLHAALNVAWTHRPPDPTGEALARHLEALRAGGWVEFSEHTRSLTVGPAFREAQRAARFRPDEAGGILHMVAVIAVILALVGLGSSQGGAGAWHTVAHLVATGWHVVGRVVAARKPQGGSQQ